MKRIFTPAKKKTILIVDDDQLAIQSYKALFQNHGYRVEVAGNDHVALQRLKKDPVHLIILDLCLPGMDGVEVLRNIRSEFDRHVLPVIVVSTAYLGHLGRAALEAGANKCVTKTDVAPDLMLKLVRELLGNGHPTAAGAASESVETPALQVAGESREELIAMLLINAPEILATLRAGHQIFARTEEEDLRRNEVSKMHRQVRWLAGPAGSLGLWRIAQVASALEALLIQLRAKPKKITPSVIRTVAQAIDTLAALFDQATNPQIEELTPPKILVVDDEIISRETICAALGKASLSATSLDDSVAAQPLLEQEKFDLIFLDLDMPGKSGLDLCVDIREMATNRTTPVVFVTSHSDFGSRAQSTLSGGSDFIAKPFLSIELAVKALSWLFRKTPEPASMVTEQGSAPAEAGRDESQSCPIPAALGNTGEEALQAASVSKRSSTVIQNAPEFVRV